MRTYKTQFTSFAELCSAYAGKVGRIDGRQSGPPSAIGVRTGLLQFQVNTDTRAEALAELAAQARAGAKLCCIPSRSGKQQKLGVNEKPIAGLYVYYMGKHDDEPKTDNGSAS